MMIRLLCSSMLLLALSGCAAKPAEPEYIVPAGAELASEMFGYSQAVRIGDWVLVSGQVGIDPKTHGFPVDFVEQAKLAFSNLDAVLKASGADLGEVVEITTYQLDMDRFQDLVDVRNQVFGEHRPAWTVLGVKALALPSVQIEVSAMAYAPKKINK
jgi:reactive intermediate/imine deaminase